MFDNLPRYSRLAARCAGGGARRQRQRVSGLPVPLAGRRPPPPPDKPPCESAPSQRSAAPPAPTVRFLCLLHALDGRLSKYDRRQLLVDALLMVPLLGLLNLHPTRLVWHEEGERQLEQNERVLTHDSEPTGRRWV